MEPTDAKAAVVDTKVVTHSSFSQKAASYFINSHDHHSHHLRFLYAKLFHFSRKTGEENANKLY